MRIPWNKGLTLDDPRVKKYAESRKRSGKGHYKNCTECGKKFWVSPSQEKSYLCSIACHASQQRKLKREQTNNWKGGIQHNHGYVGIWDSVIGKYIPEHRLVASPHTKELVVHHKNGDKADNRPENLQIMTKSEHIRLHMTKYPVVDNHKHCAICGQNKPLSEYYISSNVYDTRCKVCERERRLSAYHRNKQTTCARKV